VLFRSTDTPSVKSQLPESKWPRQCIIGLFRKSGRDLIHVNTHFDFKAEVQEKSAALILGFLAEFPEQTPIVLTGDFNTSPESRAYAIFRENGFMDLFENSHSSTFHGFTGNDLGGHIDWILYKGGLKGIRGEIIRGSFNGIYPSDHYPVVSEFEFNL
jgi:endonuclease/exonuclease/phosphatase family metal-dependent hydrolase